MDCVAEMPCAHVRVPVTVKMRVGVVNSHAGESRSAVARFDESDYEALHEFVLKVTQAGCQVAIIHARKAVLGGPLPQGQPRNSTTSIRCGVEAYQKGDDSEPSPGCERWRVSRTHAHRSMR